MNVVSIGDQVRPGTYRLHSLFRRAANFTDGERLVSVVAREIGPGPANIVVRRWSARRRTSGAPPPPSALLRVGHDAIQLWDRRWAISRMASYRSLLPYEVTRPGIFRRNLRVVERFLKTEASPKSLAFLLDPRRERHFTSAFERAFVARIRTGVRMLFPLSLSCSRSVTCSLLALDRPSPRGSRRGYSESASCSRSVSCGRGSGTGRGATAAATGPGTQGVRMLAGCGFGLTPSGDDFIAGMLIALHLLGAPQRTIRSVHAAAAGGGDLSRHFLALARDGRVDERMSALVAALLDHGDTEVRRAARRILQVGATSGADMMTGFVTTLKAGRDERLARPRTARRAVPAGHTEAEI